MEYPREDPDVQIVVRVRDNNLVQVWMRDGMEAAMFATTLRMVADNFEKGTVKRMKMP